MAAEDPRYQSQRIAVRVLFFGAARDAVGEAEITFSLSHPTNAASAFDQLLEAFPALRRFGRSLLFAVNQEYAHPERTVFDGDELAIFPSVSGGSEPDTQRRKSDASEQTNSITSPTLTADTASKTRYDFFELTTDPIDVGAVARRVVLPECGATVTLDGYAREWTKGKRTLHLVYEAYSPMALRELQRLGQQVHERFDVAHIGIVHRTGKLEIGETSVVIAVSAPHRHSAFEACEWAIRQLKRTVPIWKKEVFEGGEIWVEGSSGVE